MKIAAFSNKDLEKLIELWESEEDLWNVSSPNYHKKEARSAPIQRVKMGLTNATGKEFSGMMNSLYEKNIGFTGVFTVKTSF